MKDLVKYFLLVLFLLMTAGCKKVHIVSEGQKIFFQYDYVNCAWGYQHTGFIINNEGRVLTYNKPEKWNFPGREGLLSQNEVEENLSSCTISEKEISMNELQKYVNYIDNIAASKVSAPRRRGADRGSAIFYCYQYSESNGEYKATVIKMEGDTESENLNFFSRKVVEWMRTIGGISRK